MKRLLFLITALFVITGNAYAECALYIDDLELPQTELGTVVSVPVKAHFSARLNAFQVDMQLPSGITCVSVRPGADFDVDYYGENGEACNIVPAFSYHDGTIIGIIMDMGYWQDPNGNPDEWVNYGTIKWEGGDYDEMVILDLSISDYFLDGDIVMTTLVSTTSDERGGTIIDNGDNNTKSTRTCHVTVQDEISGQTAPPEISGYDDGINGYVVVMATEELCSIYYRVTQNDNWPEEWVLYSGELRYLESGTYHIEAYAIAPGKLASNLITYSFYYTPPVTETPIITSELTDDAVIVSATGNGVVNLYRNDVLVDNPCIVQRTDADQYVSFSATAQAEDMLISPTTYMYVYVPALEEPSPSDGISIYVNAASAPYLYSWYDGVSQCGEWPGTLLSEIVTINRVDYFVYHFDLELINIIFNNGSGSQTGDFTNITHDAYFIYNGNDLAYGLIPPEVYGNPTGEYAFYVNTDGWSKVNAVVNGNTYPMTMVGVDGAGFEVYKWEVPSLSYTPTTITFNDGYGNAVQDAYGNIYTSQYVKGGYYVYSFFQNYAQVRLDCVTTIRYEDSSQRPILENCDINLLSSNEEWNSYSNILFQITGSYFNQAARQGSVFYSVDDGSWIALATQLDSEQTFDKTVNVSFNPSKTQHTINLVAQDLSGAYSDVVTVLKTTDASTLECSNLPDVEYTGQAITFDPVIVDLEGNELVINEGYTTSFSNNVDAGDATLKIKAIYPQYIGYKSIYFTINPHTISGEAFFTDGFDQYYYTGEPVCPEVTVIDDTFGTLRQGWDYMVTYSNNELMGQALALIEGIGNFDGSIELPFEILDVLYGDVNFSRTIDITDLQAMVKYIFGEYNKPFYFLAADLNKDNIVNVQDVVGEANILLTGDLPALSTNGRYAPQASDEAQASLYWKDGTLYLKSSVPVAALDIINRVEGNICWNFGNLDMVVMNNQGQDGCHTVIFSLNDAVISPGLTAIATTSSTTHSVAAASLSDPDAELIAVAINDEISGLTSMRTDDAANCKLDGSTLIINGGDALTNLNVTVYTIEGKVVTSQCPTFQDRGCARMELGEYTESHRYLIIVVRNGRQIIATQKLTKNK